MPEPTPPWPERTLILTKDGRQAKTVWHQKYGVWFCIKSERPVNFMSFPDSWTSNRLSSLAREGWSFEWPKN